MCRCVPLHIELKDSYDDKEGVKGSGDIETIHKTIIKKTSLHLISAVSADITSGITSNITSAAGWKPQDFFVFVLVFTYCGWAC